MKNYFFFFLFIAFSFNSLCQGVIFDPIAFNKAEQLSVERTIMPEKYSLDKYLPILYPQSASTCVAMSFSLARTIMYARENKIVDKAKITAYQMSPYFMYYLARNKEDYTCTSGLDITYAATVAKQYGFTNMYDVEYPNYYPFTSNYLCPNQTNFFPPILQDNIKKANFYKVDEIYVTKTIEGVRFALSNGIPVILAMQVPKSFVSLTTAKWTPRKNENKDSTLGGHAVVAIGYNDSLYGGAIEIANSWGEGWGYKGKSWISYNDLINWLDGAFIMETSKTPKKELTTTIKKTYPKAIKKKTFKMEHFAQKFTFNNTEMIKSFKEKVQK